MKKIYDNLELEVIRFSAEDVITASVEEDSSSSGGDTLLATATLPDVTQIGLYLTPNGTYYDAVLATGEKLNDYGTRDPRG